MPPPPLTLPAPPCCRQASADVALSRCRHRRSIRAAATALPPSRCALPPRFALPPPPRFALPPPPCRRQAAADVALSRCRHRRSLRAAATALPPSRCAPPLRFALPPPPIGVLGGGIILFYLRCVFLDMCVFWADFRYLFGFC
jgi:hypothetical protein